MTVIGPSTGEYKPTNIMFEYTDHLGVSVDVDKARFLRPLEYGTLKYFTPQARIRFRSDAQTLTIRMNYNNLHSGTYYYDVMSVYVNGVWHSDYDPVDVRDVFTYDINLSFANSDFRTIEVICPYAASVDFAQVIQHPRYRVTPCQPRTVNKILCIGDSITNIFYATRSRNGWPFLLGEQLKLQSINMGFAGAYSHSHGDAAYITGMTGLKAITVLLGVNDAAAAVAQSTFKSNYTTLINGVLSRSPSTTKVFCITPIWADWPPELNLASYRTWVSDVVTTINSPRITLVNGLSLCTNATTSVADGVHPNDTGHAEMASNLRTIIQPLIT